MPTWFITPEPAPKPVVWQTEHACVVGKWLVGFTAVAVTKVTVEVWQAEQSCVPTTRCPANVLVDNGDTP